MKPDYRALIERVQFVVGTKPHEPSNPSAFLCPTQSADYDMRFPIVKRNSTRRFALTSEGLQFVVVSARKSAVLYEIMTQPEPKNT
ncbi:hypothetical protein T265_07401 [Opisthorchis viverrini]|uniref:Uncharacterized protein n=1 Tax=Opisthorchis viverrini TaxID=6198 RepID=A0A074ZD01_OPIVI|nr:hypothetical protein T265_07401 [Opisthorchis viverrini]KER25063.1 hypothetical protein T265_07401 [Opisthorchis viverrini]